MLQLNRSSKGEKENQWIDIWSAYPYDTYSSVYNRYFLNNFSFEFEKPLIPEITNLNGNIVTGAFIHYPPFSQYFVVVSVEHWKRMRRNTLLYYTNYIISSIHSQ